MTDDVGVADWKGRNAFATLVCDGYTFVIDRETAEETRDALTQLLNDD